ncbi:MAG TPA: DMT family transporter [Candidatus Saccharimonadales bacterium]
MIFVAIAAALLGSLSNAFSGVLQRRATGTPDPRELFGHRFVRRLIQNRMWLMGESLDMLGFLLQAAALRLSSLTLVEPLMTITLVFILVILRVRFRLAAKRREWGGAVAICLGLSFLLLTANPRGGHVQFNGVDWAITSGVVGAFILTSAIVVRRIPHAAWRAAIAGVAAGANFAMTAAFTKLAVNQLQYGIPNLISSWEIYALIASGITALFIMQSAYGAGPLAISTPAMQIVDPLLSVIIGLLLFGDSISLGTSSIVIELVCILAICGGIVALGGSKRIQQHSGL